MQKTLFFVLACLVLTSVRGDGADLKIEHKFTLDREGTRSEARHGNLLINGKAVPDFFWTVVAADQHFVFHQRKNMWGDDGYFPLNLPLNISAAKAGITKDDLTQGFYKGKDKKPGTPADWLYLEWKDGAGFSAPERLIDLIDFFVLAPIPRSVTGLDDLMKD
jgi:hypothetical protein